MELESSSALSCTLSNFWFLEGFGGDNEASALQKSLLWLWGYWIMAMVKRLFRNHHRPESHTEQKAKVLGKWDTKRVMPQNRALGFQPSQEPK